MAYTRRYRQTRYKRRTPYKRRARPRAGQSLMWKVARSAAAGLIKNYVNTERKFFDTSVNGTISTTPTIDTLVGGMVQGTTDINRIGSQVKFTSLSYKIRLDQNASATLSYVRCIIGLDYQPNGANPTVTDVVESSSIVSLRQKDTGKRFHILSDKVYKMSINGDRGTYDEGYFKLDMKTEFDGNAGTIADVSTNNLFFILIGSEATNTTAITMNYRLRYIDN